MRESGCATIPSTRASADAALDTLGKRAPFTTLRKEAARVVSNPLSHLLIGNYDDRASIEAIRKRNPDEFFLIEGPVT